MKSIPFNILILVSERDANDEGDLYFEYIKYLKKYSNIYVLYPDALKDQVGDRDSKNKILSFIKDNAIETTILMYTELDLFFLKSVQENTYTIFFSTDDATLFDTTTRYIGQAVDYVLSFDLITSNQYSLYGINSCFFPAHYSSDLYKPLNIEQDIDVSFVGIRNKSWRDEYITYVENNEINIESYGLGTGKFLSYQEIVEIFNRSKINLNFNGSNKLDKITDRIFQFKGRNIEVPLCATFLLTEYFKGIEEVYEIGEEIDVFYDQKSLVEKINFYLNNDEERERIAQNGYKKALTMFSLNPFEEKLINIIENGMLEKAKNTRTSSVYSNIYMDKEYLERYTFQRMVYMCKFIKNKNYTYALEELMFILKEGKIKLNLVFAGVSDFLAKSLNHITHKLKNIKKASIK